MAARNIRWKLHLQSSPEVVWNLVATDAGRQQFWCERSRRHRKQVTMEFSNGWVEEAVVLVEQAPHTMVLRYFGTPVRFDLHPDGRGGTDFELWHESVPARDFEATLPGWLNVLFPLKAVADHRIDLRNHDPSRSWDEGYVDG